MLLRQKIYSLVEELVKACIDYYGERLITAAVFGSVGRGTPNPFSDVDLLLIADNLPVGRLQRAVEFSRVESLLEGHLKGLWQEGIHTSISPVIKTPPEVLAGSWLFLDMLDDAVIYYDRGAFFQRYLEALKKRLQSLGASKIRRGERWHWELKPDYREGEVFDL